MRAFIVLHLLFLLVSCANVSQNSNPQKTCTTDTDCVPATCCHAIDAVNKAFAPNCAGTFCTMNCQPETIDCGQGEIQCVERQCRVLLQE